MEYGQTSGEVLFWTPSAHTVHLIYVCACVCVCVGGGGMGKRVDSMAVNDAQITIKVVKTGGAGNIQTGSLGKRILTIFQSNVGVTFAEFECILFQNKAQMLFKLKLI